MLLHKDYFKSVETDLILRRLYTKDNLFKFTQHEDYNELIYGRWAVKNHSLSKSLLVPVLKLLSISSALPASSFTNLTWLGAGE